MEEYNLKQIFEQIIIISEKIEKFSIDELWEWTKFDGVNEHLNESLILHKYSNSPIKGRTELLPNNQNIKGNYLSFEFVPHSPEYEIRQYNNFDELMEYINSRAGILNNFVKLQIPIINGVAKDILFALEYKDETTFEDKLDKETKEKIKRKIISICE